MSRIKDPSDFSDASADHCIPGLVLSGHVIDRIKKEVKVSDKSLEVVTYTLEADRRRFFVDDFAPESYFQIGSFVSLPVYLKPYNKKNGDASYMLKVQKENVDPSHGQRF